MILFVKNKLKRKIGVIFTITPVSWGENKNLNDSLAIKELQGLAHLLCGFLNRDG